MTRQQIVVDSESVSGHSHSILQLTNEHRGGIISINVTIIKTSYDRKRRSNVRFPAKTNRRENIVWTEGERVKAEAGEVVQDINDLHSKVSALELL